MWLAVAALLASVGAAACSTASSEAADTVVTGSGTEVPVRVVIRGEQARNARRFLDGAVACVRTLGAFEMVRGAVSAIDRPAAGQARADGGEIVIDRTPWWSSAPAMAPELAAARAVARRAWTDAVGAASMAAWFVDGLVEYTARRAVEPLFQRSNLPPGFAMLELRYFGGYVPWRIRIRLDPAGTADLLPLYRRHSRVDPGAADDADADAVLTGKVVLTLNTLDRWIGRPAFDAVLAEFVRQARARPLAVADFAAIASSVSGQDLSWMLPPMLTGRATYDYAVAELRSRDADGHFETSVTVERRGDGEFTGAATPRTGPFDSGRGMMIQTTFADGRRVVDSWDGRDRRKTFTYRSGVRAVAAAIDPDMRLLLDLNRTNNGIAVEPQTRTAATRWSVRWMLWLEQVLLTYGALA